MNEIVHVDRRHTGGAVKLDGMLFIVVRLTYKVERGQRFAKV